MKDIRTRQIFEKKKNAEVYDNPNDLIFVNEVGDFVPPGSISKAFQSVRNRAGLTEDYHLHDLRHAYVTQLLDSGISLKAVQKLVGHTSAAFTLSRYAHAVEETKKKAAQIMGDKLRGKKTQ